MNFDKTSISILSQVVFKEMYPRQADIVPSKAFWDSLQVNTIELARTILRVDKKVNPDNK